MIHVMGVAYVSIIPDGEVMAPPSMESVRQWLDSAQLDSFA